MCYHLLIDNNVKIKKKKFQQSLFRYYSHDMCNMFGLYIIYYFDIIAIDLTHFNNILISLF